MRAGHAAKLPVGTLGVSSAHWKPAFAFVDENVNWTSVSGVVPDGPESIRTG